MPNKFPRLSIGSVIETNSCGPVQVLRIKSYKEVLVKFLNTGTTYEFATPDIRRGSLKDRNMPTVFGVGYVGYGKYSSKKNDTATTEYKRWHAMLQRCYSDKFQKKFPQYIGYSVCDEWKNYQIFAEWLINNAPKKIDDYQLTIKTGNEKIYSPDNCIFLTFSQNQNR